MNSPFTVDMARSAQTDQMGQDVQSKLRGLKTSNLSPEAKEKKLREACQGFESIFIQKMWQEMRKTVQQTSFMHGREEQFWQDMYDQELAKKMTSAGGIGLADMMYEQLSSHLTSASKVTAGNMGLNHSFMPSQAPLLPNKQNPKETPLPPRAEPMYEEVGAVAEQEESTMQMPQPQAQTIGAGPKKEESVDPAIENALATMRANVEMNEATRRIQAMPLADVSYSEPHLRQQPVAGSFDMVKAARRQAGDQLGSRGVREPLFPQTETARIATEKANERRQARKRSRVSAEPQQPQQPEEAPSSATLVSPDLLGTNIVERTLQAPKPNSFFAPMAKAETQQQPLVDPLPNSRDVRKENTTHVVKTSNLPRSQHRQSQAQTQIRTLNLNPQSTLPPVQQVAANKEGQPKESTYTIPPLTASDLGSM